MAENLYFSRDTEVYIRLEGNSTMYKIPVLDGFSFSQAVNSSDITVSEMGDETRRGMRKFNDSLAPAEWSFSTYARPFLAGGVSTSTYANGGGGHADVLQHAVEEVLWAMMVGSGATETGQIATTSDNGATLSGVPASSSWTLYDSDGTIAGTGKGAQFLITSDGTGTDIDSVVVIDGGEGYEVDDTVTFPAAIFGASGDLVVTIATTQDGLVSGTISTDISTGTNGTYVLAQDSSDGVGTGLVVSVEVDSNSVSGYTVLNPGTGHQVGDIVSFDVTPITSVTGDFDITISSIVSDDFQGFNRETSKLTIDWSSSNKSTLGVASIYFNMPTDSTNPLIYKLTKSVVNEASVDFEIDGIATINWSGFGSEIVKMTKTEFENEMASGDAGIPGDTGVTAFITEGTVATNAFIRNRITTLDVTAGDSINYPGSGAGNYNITLTGASLTISNNMTYLTPEELGIVNVPIGHVTGGRSISGSFNAYVVEDPISPGGTSSDLYQSMIANKTDVSNEFALTFTLGGSSLPNIKFTIPKAHLEIPVHSIEDIIALETSFAALPSTISETDEMTVVYTGQAV